jgi:hypothetical protein
VRPVDYDPAMAEFDAYALDCRVHGQIELGEGRLSDQLAHIQELVVRDARLEDLSDGHHVELPELTIDRAELCAVVASEPRGDRSRRLHTWTTRVVVEVGPYLVHGRVHGRAGSTPLGLSLQRQPWVPLTDATVEYHCGADVVVEEMATLLINREVMRSYRAVDELGVAPPTALRWSPQTPAGPGAETPASAGLLPTPPPAKPVE